MESQWQRRTTIQADALADQSSLPRAGDLLHSYHARVEADLARWRHHEAALTWMRMAAFLAAAAAWYLLRAWPPVAVLVPVVFLGLFVHAVRRHRHARHERRFRERQLQILGEMRRRQGGTVVRIRAGERPQASLIDGGELPSTLDSGPCWALTHQELDDLDLYAEPVGVFGLLNRTSSVFGARRLSGWLEHPCVSHEHIMTRQAAVRSLAESGEQRVRIMAGSLGLRDHEQPAVAPPRVSRLEALLHAVRRAEPLPWPRLGAVLRCWSVLCLLATLPALAKLLSSERLVGWGAVLLVVVLVVALINSTIYSRLLAAALTRAIRPWRALKPVAEECLEAARRAGADLPEAGPLEMLSKRCQAMAASAVLPALCRRLAWTDAGGLFHVVLNHLFFYDLHVGSAVLGRAVAHRDVLLDGLAALADVEALCSLACLAAEQPLASWPVFTEEPHLRIDEGVHPLIAPEHAVANSIELTRQCSTWIITGSNMAGKSTFLRMIGVNVLLAHSGTVALAIRMAASPLRLMTDLRIRDDLARNESYFLAEVRQLRRMIDPGCGPRLLGLVDEPFRGTNSAERVAASAALVDHLCQAPHFFVVATHEQALTELANGGAARNYHFREEISRSGEVFDYLLRPGPATVRNALRLMEREGYPASIMHDARRRLNGSDGAQQSEE